MSHASPGNNAVNLTDCNTSYRGCFEINQIVQWCCNFAYAHMSYVFILKSTNKALEFLALKMRHKFV